MAGASGRPLSPHLQVYKWGPHMTVSILHRVSGFILASAGALTLVWWLMAISMGPEAYESFRAYVVAAPEGDSFAFASNIFFRLLGVAVTWGFFQHLFSGLRHFVMDMGTGYELKQNKFWSTAVMLLALLATLLLWGAVFLGCIGG